MAVPGIFTSQSDCERIGEGTEFKDEEGNVVAVVRNGNLVDSWVSTTEIHKVKLLPGTYTLSETIAPEGYILSTETVTFTVKADGTVTKVEMKNMPIRVTEIEISKVDVEADDIGCENFELFGRRCR